MLHGEGRLLIRVPAILAFGMLLAARTAFGQSEPAAPSRGNAPKLVREANELLRSDKPTEALRSYEEAQKLKPDAREIAFDQALAHYRLGDFEQAREAFNRAAGGKADALAEDALYGLGTCDHAEALASQDPKEAVGKIENAMRNYQSVLSAQPEHAAARDANLKAASYWRQLKQQMQQQQQQQQDQNQQNQEDNQEQQQDQQQENQDQQQNQQQSSNENKQEQQQSQQQEQKENEQKEQKEQQSSAQEQEKKEEREQQKAAQQKEEASRDQAERKLRELMQAMRDRKKHRREDQQAPTYRPAEKDW